MRFREIGYWNCDRFDDFDSFQVAASCPYVCCVSSWGRSYKKCFNCLLADTAEEAQLTNSASREILDKLPRLEFVAGETKTGLVLKS